jgi:glycosyltransferase involved in cell wall biosynthesis
MSRLPRSTAGGGRLGSGAVPAGVIIPVHGFAPYLAEALDAVLAERPAAVVVVDDGSSLPLALHPDHAAAGVRLVRREVCGGPAAARATGLAALPDALELVALCDADDAWAPGFLETVAGALEAEPEAGWAFGRALVVGPDGRATGEQWERPRAGRHPAAALARELYEADPVPTSSVVLRRSALAAAGGFLGPVRVAEDWELWLRLARAGQDALCVPEATVRYRRHPDGLTADVARLARAQLALHAAHADLVGPQKHAAAEARDLAALADGLARDGDRRGALGAWGQVAARRRLSAREQAKRAALAAPGGARLLGRTDPYRA